MMPTIVKVATGVTSRIVEPSAFSEVDLDQILNVPNYIYFEEHHPVESYPRPHLIVGNLFGKFEPLALHIY